MNKLFKSLTSLVLTLTLVLTSTIIYHPTEVQAATNLVSPTSKTIKCTQTLTLKVKGAKNNKIRIGGKNYTIKWKVDEIIKQIGNDELDQGFDFTPAKISSTGKVTPMTAGKIKFKAYYTKGKKNYTLGTAVVTIKHAGTKTGDIRAVSIDDSSAPANAKICNFYTCSACKGFMLGEEHKHTNIVRINDGFIKNCVCDKRDIGCDYAEDYYYSEQEVYDILKNAIEYNDEYYDYYLGTLGYSHSEYVKKCGLPSQFLKWGVKKGYFHKDVIDYRTHGMEPDEKDCSGSAYIAGCLLGGNNHWETISTNPDKFDYTTLKPGDVLFGRRHVEVFLCYTFLDEDVPLSEDIHDYIDKYGINHVGANFLRYYSGQLNIQYRGMDEFDTGDSSILGSVHRLDNLVE